LTLTAEMRQTLVPSIPSRNWRAVAKGAGGVEDEARRNGEEEVMSKAASQKSLDKWTKQKWRTKSGKPSTQGPKATGERYLPEKAIKALSPSEYAATTKAKREGTRKGKQFVKQPKGVAKKTAQIRKGG
jgi:hypothetical protein